MFCNPSSDGVKVVLSSLGGSVDGVKVVAAGTAEGVSGMAVGRGRDGAASL